MFQLLSSSISGTNSLLRSNHCTNTATIGILSWTVNLPIFLRDWRANLFLNQLIRAGQYFQKKNLRYWQNWNIAMQHFWEIWISCNNQSDGYCDRLVVKIWGEFYTLKLNIRLVNSEKSLLTIPTCYLLAANKPDLQTFPPASCTPDLPSLGGLCWQGNLLDWHDPEHI